MKQPLISCLCVTKNDEKMLDNTIKTFCNQTWKNKELVFVTVESNPYLDYIKSKTNDEIKLFVVEDGTTLGSQRNTTVQKARGEYIIIWDDDDDFADERIEVMYNALVKQGALCSLLSSVTMRNVSTGETSESNLKFTFPASMLAIKKEMPMYPSINFSEDMAVMHYFNKPAIVKNKNIYTYNIHGKNTVPHEQLISYMK